MSSHRCRKCGHLLCCTNTYMSMNHGIPRVVRPEYPLPRRNLLIAIRIQAGRGGAVEWIKPEPTGLVPAGKVLKVHCLNSIADRVCSRELAHGVWNYLDALGVAGLPGLTNNMTVIQDPERRGGIDPHKSLVVAVVGPIRTIAWIACGHRNAGHLRQAQALIVECSSCVGAAVLGPDAKEREARSNNALGARLEVLSCPEAECIPHAITHATQLSGRRIQDCRDQTVIRGLDIVAAFTLRVAKSSAVRPRLTRRSRCCILNDPGSAITDKISTGNRIGFLSARIRSVAVGRTKNQGQRRYPHKLVRRHESPASSKTRPYTMNDNVLTPGSPRPIMASGSVERRAHFARPKIAPRGSIESEEDTSVELR